MPAPEAGSGGTTFGHQVALNANGTHWHRCTCSEYGDGAPFSARLQTFDVGGDEPVLLVDVTLELMSPAAGLSFAGLRQHGSSSQRRRVPPRSSPSRRAEAQVTHLGQPEFRSNASLVNFGFSIDGTRSCSLGARLQLFDVAQQEQVIDLPANGISGSCVPEACAGSTANVLAEVEAGSGGNPVLTCFAPDGSTRGDVDNNLRSSTLVPLLGLESLEAAYDHADQWEISPQSDDGIDVPYCAGCGTGRSRESAGLDDGGSWYEWVAADQRLGRGRHRLWTIGNGILDPIRNVESPSEIERLVPDSSLSTGTLLSLGVANEADKAAVLDAETGEMVDAFPEPVDSASFDQIERLLGTSELLVISPTGSATVYGSSGIANTYDVASEEEYQSRLTAVTDRTLVAASGSTVRVIDPSSGDEVAELSERISGPVLRRGGVV